jgi:hypothetical protein
MNTGVDKLSSDLEHILTLSDTETASSKATLVFDFIENKHSIAEFATFFYWLANELSKGEVEFMNLVFNKLQLNKSSARLLSVWLLRILG